MVSGGAYGVLGLDLVLLHARQAADPLYYLSEMKTFSIAIFNIYKSHR